MAVMGVSCDDAVLRPAHDRVRMDSETGCRLLFCQHSSVSKAIVARTEPILMDKIGDPQIGETSLAPPRSCRSAWPKSLVIEEVGDLGINVIVKELVDEFDDLRLGLDLLRGGLWIQRRERLGLAALEADMDLGRSFRWEFDERRILDDVSE